MSELTNTEIVTLAVYLLGGEARAIDVEDIAIKVNELAPGRFSWRKYKDQINLDSVRRRLSQAKTEEGYLGGSGTDGWLLTEAGLAFAKKKAEAVPGFDLGRETLSPRERQWRRRERVRMLSSSACMKFDAGREKEITDKDAAAFFRLDDYVRGEARDRKVARIVNVFGDDPELGSLVSSLAERVRGDEDGRS